MGQGKFLFQIILLVLSLVLLLGCTEEDFSNTTDSNSTPLVAPVNPYSNVAPSADSLTQSQTLVTSASTALTSGDKEGFVKLLSSDLQKAIGSAEMDSTEAKKLATAIASATVLKRTENMIVYETTIDGEKITFYTVKEGGVWVIEGL